MIEIETKCVAMEEEIREVNSLRSDNRLNIWIKGTKNIPELFRSGFWIKDDNIWQMGFI